MIAITLYKQKHGYNPSLEDPCNPEDKVTEVKKERGRLSYIAIRKSGSDIIITLFNSFLSYYVIF